MDSMTLSLVIFLGCFIVFLFSGWLIAFSIGASSALAYIIISGGSTISNFAYLGYNATINYNLLALPLFILMGELMIQGGIAKTLYSAITPLMERIRGGLIYVNVLSNTVLGACCGSTIAATSAISTVAIPELHNRGYAKGISYGSLASAGNLAALIPPSIGLILYAAITDTSLGELFLAGIVPGLILTCTLLFVSAMWIKLNSKIAPPREKNPMPVGRSVGFAISRLWPLLILIVIVLGSIYLGFATPTEAGTYGVIGAIILGIGRINLKTFKISLVDTVRASVPLLFIIAMASIYGYALNSLGLRLWVATLLDGLIGPPCVKMFSIWFLLLMLGMFLDAGSAIVLTTPILLPFALSLGYDPVWYGIWLSLAVELGNITPPVGLTIFAVQAISGDKLDTIARGALPFWISFVLAQLSVTFFPGIVLLLPNMAL